MASDDIVAEHASPVPTLNAGGYAALMPKHAKDPDSITPLSAPVFYILLSLADRERHGYAIIKEVKNLTDGKVKLSTGTLYAAVRRLLDGGLIQETEERPHPALDDERRRYYRLTPFGEEVARAEVNRMVHLTGVALEKKLISTPSSGPSSGDR
jgi:DNA-binding PadR family transcriptional regulator